MNTSKAYILSILIISLLITLITGCGEEEQQENTSFDQIHKEEGTPVEVSTMKSEPFKKQISFYATLKGIKEASEYAMLTDRILKVNGSVGSHVNKGDVLVEFPVDNPTFQYKQAELAYENSKKTYNRLKNLLEAGETSQAQFDGAETKYLVDKRNFEAIKQMLHVEAPISGVITEMNAEPGITISKENPLFTIAQTHIVRATMWVTDKEISSLKIGMEATLHHANRTYVGKITEITLNMNPRTKAYEVEAQFNNTDKLLSSGLTADVLITIYENDSAIVLQKNVVQESQEESFVFIAQNSQAHRHKVTVGNISGNAVEITEGLNVGDRVITSGMTLVKDGEKIKVVN